MELIRAGIQPSEIWKMTVPEYTLLMIRAREDRINDAEEKSSEDTTVIRCTDFEDFAIALAATRGRME